MERLHSIWLVPEMSDEMELKSIADELSTKYKAPTFIPHLTIIGDAAMDFQTAKDAIETTFQGISAFDVKTRGVNFSERFNKAVFIEFELDENLKSIFESISSKTEKRSINTFKPHLSLIYSKIPIGEKGRIAKSLKIKDKYRFDRVGIVEPWKLSDELYEVDKWEILYQKGLNN